MFYSGVRFIHLIYCLQLPRTHVDTKNSSFISRVEGAYSDTVCYFDTPRVVPSKNNEQCGKTTIFVRGSIFNRQSNFRFLRCASALNIGTVFTPRNPPRSYPVLSRFDFEPFSSTVFRKQQYHKVSNQVIFLVQKAIHNN